MSETLATRLDNEPPIGYIEGLGEHASNPPAPRTSGDVLVTEVCVTCLGRKRIRSSGSGLNWKTCGECEGSGKARREWTVAPCEARLKAQFEQWVRKSAKRAIADAELEDGPEEAQKQRDAYQASYGAGHYTWEGRHCRNARGDLPGIRYLLYLCLHRCHSEITELQVNALFEDNPRGCGLCFAWALGNSEAPPVTETDGADQKPPMKMDMTPTDTTGERLTDSEWKAILVLRKKKATMDSP